MRRAVVNARFHGGRTRAFTVLELLVAAGITVVLAAIIAGMVGNVSSTMARTSGKLGAAAQARLALDQLTLDLQSALYRDDGATWLSASITGNATTQSGLWVPALTPARGKPANNAGARGSSLDLFATRQGLLNPGAANRPGPLSDARYGVAGTWLRFFTTARGSNTSLNTLSVPVAVGWQIVRRRATANTASSDQRYFLHRAEVRPTADTTGRPGTLEAGFNFTSTGPYEGNTSANNSGGTTGDPRSVRTPGSATNLESIIAENVIDFGVRFHVHTINADEVRSLTQIYPAATNDLTHAATLPPGIANGAGNYVDDFPEVVDVMIRVLTEEGAKQIAAMEASPSQPTNRPLQYGSDAEWWWAVAEANSQVFTRRIVIRAKPL